MVKPRTMSMKQPARPPLSSAVFPLLLLLPSLPTQLIAAQRPDESSIQITNDSGNRIEVHWVHPDTGETVLQAPEVLPGTGFSLNSFVGHSFQVRELPTGETEVCGGEEETCRVNYFTVNDNQDQVFMIKDGIDVEHTDAHAIAARSASTLLSDCKSKAKSQLAASSDPVTANTILDDLTSCAQRGIAVEIEHANEEIAFQAKVRKDLAGMVENYTCADESMNTTEAHRVEYWDNDGDDVVARSAPRKVHVMIDRPASRIHLISNFMNADECQAVEEAAEPILHDATVADGSGGSKLSESRKAKQAGIKVHWKKEEEGDLIAKLSRRVYDYVNHVLPFDIKENGQEDLMSIQYFGRGAEDKTPDRYMPHCDGDCTGLEFKPGNRMATIVMYCEVPAVGGATRFRNSNIHVKPEQYSATFFSYIDPETMKMDNGFTEHSGCPVVEGKKKIVTQWVRVGVDDENRWDSFNTLGIKYSDAADQ